MASSFDFAAEFGGQDAAQSVLPHFQALKQAAKEASLEGFPFPNLTFILRVDGEVHAHGIPGLSNIDVARKADYVSVDIGVTIEDRDALRSDPAEGVISEAILATIPFLVDHGDKRLEHIDEDAMAASLEALTERYLHHLAHPSGRDLRAGLV